MKFAHLSDIHIGGWKEERLKELNLQCFIEAIKKCVNNKVAFVLISGDLFNTALPQIDLIREVAHELDYLRQHDIETYIIPGSHDFSPSGKTMLDVLEKAGLVVNVFKPENGKVKFVTDKTGAKIAGVLGRKAMLDKYDYMRLNKEELEKEKGFKIFMFHTIINDVKPKKFEFIEGESLESFPKGFNYYAGGHPHYTSIDLIENYGYIAYPGALFPNNFQELEEFKHGGFYILDYNNGKLEHKWEGIKLKDVVNIELDVTGKSSIEVEKLLLDKLGIDVNDKIVTIRVFGVLEHGKVSDINFKKIFDYLYSKGAYCVLRNTYKLLTKEFEEVKVEGSSSDEIEEILIKEHIGQVKVDFDEILMTKELIKVLNDEKNEGETNLDFERRLLSNVSKVMSLEELR